MASRSSPGADCGGPRLDAMPFFRFQAKIGEAGGTLIYQVAEEPFLYLGRTVKCLGMLTPWSCAVCGQSVDSRPDR